MARDDGKFEDFDARMRQLRSDARLEQAETDERPVERATFGTGIQVGIELVAGVIGGALIGYGLDRWLETWPLAFLIFFFLGALAGMLNAYRHIRRASAWPDKE